MWQRFTERARKVVFYAQEEAQRFGEGFVSTEHLLLGILREEDNVATRVLVALGFTPDGVRTALKERMPNADPKPSVDMTLTPRAKRVIDLGYDEARGLRNDYIGTEHLLLGLIKEADGVAGRVLSELGVVLADARRETEAIQRLESARPRPDPGPPRPARTTAPPPDPWAGFDPFARRAALFAELEALRRGQAAVSPEHLLLGLLREAESPAVRVLKATGIAVDAVHDAASAASRDTGTPRDGEATFSPATDHAFRIAYREQARARADRTGAPHFLLGLLLEPDGMAGRVLEGLGLDADRLRAAIAETEA